MRYEQMKIDLVNYDGFPTFCQNLVYFDSHSCSLTHCLLRTCISGNFTTTHKCEYLSNETSCKQTETRW